MTKVLFIWALICSEAIRAKQRMAKLIFFTNLQLSISQVGPGSLWTPRCWYLAVSQQLLQDPPRETYNCQICYGHSCVWSRAEPRFCYVERSWVQIPTQEGFSFKIMFKYSPRYEWCTSKCQRMKLWIWFIFKLLFKTNNSNLARQSPGFGSANLFMLYEFCITFL